MLHRPRTGSSALLSATGFFAATLVASCDGCDEGEVVGRTFALCIEPSSVDFGAQELRTDGSRTLVVQNCGGAAISDLAVRIGEVDDDVEAADAFAALPTEVQAPLEPGETFLLPVRFRPSEPRAYEASLVFELPGAQNSELLTTVSLAGEGVPRPGCDLVPAPSPADFGDAAVGSVVVRDVELTNEGLAACALAGARIVLGHADFALLDAPADELAPGASTTVRIAFSPTTAGARAGRFAVVVGGGAEVAVALAGDGTSSDACRLVADPAVLALARAQVGAPASEGTVTIENQGQLDCTLSSVSIVVGAGSFTVVSPPAAGTVVAVSQSIQLIVRFAPAAAGDADGVLTIATTEGPALDVPLVSFGDPSPTCALRFDPTPLAFGDLATGLVVERDVAILNASDVACTLTGARIDPLGAADYVVVTAPPVGVLSPGDQTSARVRFTPGAAAPALGALLVDIEDAAPQELALIGFGGFGRLVLTPTLQQFGIVTEGCVSRTFELTLTNTGDVAARIDAASTSAVSDPGFQLLLGPVAGSMLAAQASTPIRLRMAAAPAPGPSSGTLVVQSTGTPDAVTRAALFGATESLASAQRTDVFVQRGRPAVDILFVVDDSGSMSEEQANVAMNFAAFIQFTAGLDIDYQIGIVTTDVSRDGELVAPFITNSGANPTADPVGAFVTAVNVGTSGSASERGLESARLALTPPATDGVNAGFLREDALLSIIFVSDEEDQSPGDVADYVDAYLAAKDYDAEAVIASAVAGDVPLGCDGAGGSATAGGRYFAVAAALQGVFASICTPDWATVMAELGLTTFDALSRFSLSRLPDEASITVTVDGVPVPEDPLNGWTYDPDTNSVRFHGTAVPVADDEVSVSYTAECIAP